jgi:hypothetical protein
MGAELFHTDWQQTDRLTFGPRDVSKQIVALRNFADAPKVAPLSSVELSSKILTCRLPESGGFKQYPVEEFHFQFRMLFAESIELVYDHSVSSCFFERSQAETYLQTFCGVEHFLVGGLKLQLLKLMLLQVPKINICGCTAYRNIILRCRKHS